MLPEPAHPLKRREGRNLRLSDTQMASGHQHPELRCNTILQIQPEHA